jgi:hypothetical protein
VRYFAAMRELNGLEVWLIGFVVAMLTLIVTVLA